MARIPPEAKVGIFVLLAAVILLYLTLTIGGLSVVPRQRGQTLTIFFPDVAGLFPKSPVKMAGVDVGEVERISLEQGRARVTVRLKRGVAVPQNAMAAIRSIGILGERYIAISVRKPGPPPGAFQGDLPIETGAADADALMTQFSGTIAAVHETVETLREIVVGAEGEASVKQLLERVQNLVDDLRLTVGENRDNFTVIVENVERLSTTLREAADVPPGSLSNTVRQLQRLATSLNANLPKTLASLERLVNTMESVVGENRETLKSGLTSLHSASQNLPATIEALRDISTALAKGQGSAGKLLTDETLYTELRSAIQQLKTALTSLSNISTHIDEGKGALGALVKDTRVEQQVRDSIRGVRKLTGSFSNLRGSLGLRLEHQFDEDETKGRFSFKLYPTRDAFFLFEAIEDPRRLDSGESDLGDLRFSFQGGKRLGNAALRVGVIENTFGIGADYWAFSERLEFSVDAYDFAGDASRSADDHPHLNVETRLNLPAGFYATVGVDDVLDGRLRTMFLGAGFEFRWGDWRRGRR